MMQADTTDPLTTTRTPTARTAPTAPTARRMGGNGAVARDEKVMPLSVSADIKGHGLFIPHLCQPLERSESAA